MQNIQNSKTIFTPGLLIKFRIYFNFLEVLINKKDVIARKEVRKLNNMMCLAIFFSGYG